MDTGREGLILDFLKARGIDAALSFEGLYTQKAKKILNLAADQNTSILKLQKNPNTGDKRQGKLGEDFNITLDRNATSGFKVGNGVSLGRNNEILVFSPKDLNSVFWGKLTGKKLSLNIIIELNSTTRSTHSFFSSIDKTNLNDLFPLVISTMIDGKKTPLFVGDVSNIPL